MWKSQLLSTAAELEKTPQFCTWLSWDEPHRQLVLLWFAGLAIFANWCYHDDIISLTLVILFTPATLVTHATPVIPVSLVNPVTLDSLVTLFNPKSLGLTHSKYTLVILVTQATLVILVSLVTLVILVSLTTLAILVTLVTLVTLFQSSNQFYRAEYITIWGFLFDCDCDVTWGLTR